MVRSILDVFSYCALYEAKDGNLAVVWEWKIEENKWGTVILPEYLVTEKL